LWIGDLQLGGVAIGVEAGVDLQAGAFGRVGAAEAVVADLQADEAVLALDRDPGMRGGSVLA